MTAPSALAETRSLKLHFIHTGEKAEIVFKRNGRYDQGGLKKINQILRDWRRNEPTKMDPRLFDVIWEAYRQSGASGYINVVCGYRSPATNSMLRSRSKGVAEKSQHMLGKAMDFYIPGVKLAKLRAIGLKLQAGGVGYYPRSGSPFVHFDVGNVRHWPKMSRKELVAVFPNGKTLHVPSDGKPLPGFDQALAAYKARKSSGDLAVASAYSGGGRKSGGGGLLAALFGGGGGADDEEDSSPAAVAPVKAKPAKRAPAEQPVAVARASEEELPGIQVIAPDKAKRADIRLYEEPAAPAVEEPVTSPETIIAALPPREVPLPEFAPRPQADLLADTIAAAEPVDVPFATASIDPEATAVPSASAPESQLAMNVPLPSWRPDREVLAEAPQPTLPAMVSIGPKGQDPVLLAIAEEQTGSTVAAAKVAALAAPLPTSRPELGARVLNASLPRSALPGVEPAVALRADIEENAGRVAALEALASPKLAVRARASGTDPVAAVGSGVKTTRKSARAAPRDSRPQPRPVVVAAQPSAARWAFDKEYVARSTAGTKAPSFAYNVVRTAPREVYAAGFQQGSQAEAHRFTGKAVKFLSLARFETN